MLQVFELETANCRIKSTPIIAVYDKIEECHVQCVLVGLLMFSERVSNINE